MSSRLFGTDGVRGVANKDLTPLLAFNLGRAGAYVLSEVNQKPVLVVGKDTRISCDMLESALMAGICSVGADVINVGVMPTPAVAYLTRYFGADAGVVISASHNPVEHNGIKFFNKDGFKLPDAMEDKIEALIKGPNDDMPNPTGAGVGRIKRQDGLRAYVDFIKSAGISLRGMRIALDCANGASYMTAPTALSELGADIQVINASPDGLNINVNCGSTHIEALAEFVKTARVDVGLAFDGDADRLIAVDENGEVVDGDHIMAICGIYLNERGMLKKSTVVTTVMSNMGLEVALKRAGINMVRTKVGDRYVLEEMLAQGYNLGGEQSGHIILLDHNTTGDGLMTAVNLLKVMADTKKPLSELKQVMKIYPQVLLNVVVKDKSKYDNNEVIRQAIAEAEKTMGEKGRIVVRPSGTEPMVRVMVEGEDASQIQTIAEEIAAVIKREL